MVGIGRTPNKKKGRGERVPEVTWRLQGRRQVREWQKARSSVTVGNSVRCSHILWWFQSLLVTMVDKDEVRTQEETQEVCLQKQ